LWGTPVYDWESIRKSGFAWWLSRIGQNLKLYDRLRLDHFRGFVAYWEVPAGESTAVNGQWVKAPAMEFFDAVKKHYPLRRIIAEDLGVITQDVREVMEAFGFPGMKILLFAFGGDVPSNPYIPHNYKHNAIVYTGTHDNNTIRGWYENEASAEERARLLAYLGLAEAPPDLHWELIRLAMSSVADISIMPMQDLLGLGEESRMNRPQHGSGNWKWRLTPEQITRPLRDRLSLFTWMYGRE
jgi:4-alpha-glucanotransferase